MTKLMVLEIGHSKKDFQFQVVEQTLKEHMKEIVTFIPFYLTSILNVLFSLMSQLFI
ncbi:hypothetical protein [Terribacillus saccharophilus]|uniref:hypothetical protein n=1 Tax=Terribacillus saccharophilus TaxID=361277 RepID=UPI001595BC24|nr:hypothetical protein [Terribacillus saccharophilus]